jgi:hypothetical protein
MSFIIQKGDSKPVPLKGNLCYTSQNTRYCVKPNLVNNLLSFHCKAVLLISLTILALQQKEQFNNHVGGSKIGDHKSAGSQKKVTIGPLS